MAPRPLVAALEAWPFVLGELDTVCTLAGQGWSLARFGDGELKLCEGRGYRDQAPNRRLSAELREILRNPPANLLPGIPTMNPTGPTIEYWRRFHDRFLPLLDARVTYGSAFVGREDHAWDVETPAYVETLSSLWRARPVVVVCSRSNKTLRVRREASEVYHVECPKSNAWDVVDDLERRCLEPPANVVLLSCGVTATALAARLAARGVQAIDLGSAAARILLPVENEEPEDE